MGEDDLSAKPKKRKQHRRSISISRATYQRLKLYCEANNISMSQVVEISVAKTLEGFVAPPPEPKPEPPPEPKLPASVLPGTAKAPTTAAEARAALNPPTHIQKKPDARPDLPKKPAPLPVGKIFTF